jgi:hypothetical protein
MEFVVFFYLILFLNIILNSISQNQPLIEDQDVLRHFTYMGTWKKTQHIKPY